MKKDKVDILINMTIASFRLEGVEPSKKAMRKARKILSGKSKDWRLERGLSMKNNYGLK